MKTHVFTIVAAGLLLAALSAWSVAAPLPPGKPRERAILKDHKAGFSCLVFSPDGKMLATAGGWDHTVRLWDVDTGKCTAILTGHGGDPKRLHSVDFVAFHPDGKTLVSTTSDMTINLWDIAAGKSTATLKYHCYMGEPVFSPDGKTLVVKGGPLLFWDLEKKAIRASVEVKAMETFFTYDPRGELLVVGKNYHPESAFFSRWDANTGKRSIHFKGHSKAVSSLAFSRDGKTVASGSFDHTIRLWDVATGKNTATFTELPGLTCALAFSADGKVLAASYKHQEADGKTDAFPQRGSVRLYETATGRVLATLEGKPGPIGPLAFSPDGRTLASGSFGKNITLWSLPTRYR